MNEHNTRIQYDHTQEVRGPFEEILSEFRPDLFSECCGVSEWTITSPEKTRDKCLRGCMVARPGQLPACLHKIVQCSISNIEAQTCACISSASCTPSRCGALRKEATYGTIGPSNSSQRTTTYTVHQMNSRNKYDSLCARKMENAETALQQRTFKTSCDDKHAAYAKW